MNLEPVVLAWIAVAAVGTVFALDALATANEDHLLARSRRDGSTNERRLEAALTKGDVVAARWIVAQEFGFLIVGLLALSQPPPEHRTITGWTIVAVILAAAAVLPVRLYAARRRRRRLVRYLD